MTLNEFIEACKIEESKTEENETVVVIPLKDGSHGRLYVKDAESDYDAYERAFLALNQMITK